MYEINKLNLTDLIIIFAEKKGEDKTNKQKKTPLLTSNQTSPLMPDGCQLQNMTDTSLLRLFLSRKNDPIKKVLLIIHHKMCEFLN